MKRKTIILGAGITGLSAGIDTGWDIYEAAAEAGGMACSYAYAAGEPAGQPYWFERAGGHWFFFPDERLSAFVQALSPLRRYARNAAVFLSPRRQAIAYPLQCHLACLSPRERAAVERETAVPVCGSAGDQRAWFLQHFGTTLCELFFFPFHQRYTAGLYPRLAPPEFLRTPRLGRNDGAADAGYNKVFFYPEGGLRRFIAAMAARCRIHYGKRVVRIDLPEHRVFFQDGSGIRYDRLISSLPLPVMLSLTGAAPEFGPADPYTSLLVVNIVARRGCACPAEHWMYTPHAQSGFYRVGFYSNVASMFLPRGADPAAVSLYVEKAYPGGTALSPRQIAAICREITNELNDWGYIDAIVALSPQWIDCAYCWSFAGSAWKDAALSFLAGQGITQLGRYGRWNRQGMSDCLRQGLTVNCAWQNYSAGEPRRLSPAASALTSPN
ncbi:MAG: FAD-dependent oxidoreductase [Candidatus Omnitrophica bacterium]|nr:FAD-dependent oxidoreductase [Candidatus Omnitrophota bacterium]